MRIASLVAGTALAILAIATACQDPTQVTLDVGLTPGSKCAAIASGTTITVGVDPTETEDRVVSGFVTARTTACDDASGHIGTLVITPNDAGRASVIVVVGFDGADPSTCRPPDYQGCIVVRRRFAFSDHTRLTMPIEIDPSCAGVPCDALSTCTQGSCFSSETKCTGRGCNRPGIRDDGRVDEGGVVIPDAGAFLPPGVRFDGGLSKPTSCTNGRVTTCGGVDCPSGICCLALGADTCDGTCDNIDLACCTDGSTTECPPNYTCQVKPASGSGIGRCTFTPGTPPPPTSFPVCFQQHLYCGDGLTCDVGTTCCSTTNTCIPIAECTDTSFRCCAKEECPGNGNCTFPRALPEDGTPVGFCDAL